LKSFKPFPLVARHLGIAAAIGIGVGISGCAVGPNFRQPALPSGPDNSYTPTPMPVKTDSAPVEGGAAQNIVLGQDIPAQWWTVFHSPALDALVRAALAQSPNVAAAEAALREAQENYKAEVGTLAYPSVTGQLGGARQHASELQTGIPGGGVYNLYNASVNVSYTPDVFGATRRTLESAQAGIDYQRFQLEATWLSLTANVVTTAIQEASLRAQLKATRDVLTALTDQLNLIEKQFEFGAIARATLLTQRNQVAQAQATIPPLEKALAQTRHQLSVLAGKLPSEAGMPEFELAQLTLPEQLPVSLPSNLARQRPDVRASEELLHQASANVGVATANLYPQFTLSGSYGTSSLTPHDVFEAKNVLWNLTAGLTQPIFNGGALTARRRAAEAAYDSAAAQYRGTLLVAFQNVADSLRALDSDATTLKATAQAEAYASESLDLAKLQYKLGAINYLVLLDAQRTYQQSHVQLVQAQAARYADTAALFQSLGGGWWNRDPATLAAATSADASTSTGSTRK
jgi:NodT family efflux transporter outer membrane factor (OMF) lipoprotein